jgi:hypothetical protein
MVALLQEEIARLEQELRSHQRDSWGPGPGDLPSPDDDVALSTVNETAMVDRVEVDRLKCELANREETVTLLLDQLTLLEEAKAAGRAEWEHLTEWVAELEQRVAGQDPDAFRDLRAQVSQREREAEELRTKSEQDRRGWEVQRQVYEEEIARLHAGLAVTRIAAPAPREAAVETDPGGPASLEAIRAVEQENLRLRVAQEMAERTAAENSTVLRAKLGEIQNEFDTLRDRLIQTEDERRRERLEYDTTVAELRNKLSQTALVEPEPPRPAETPQRSNEKVESELRFRALKQHLREIHEREETERRERSLKHRLSRIWSRTNPP